MSKYYIQYEIDGNIYTKFYDVRMAVKHISLPEPMLDENNEIPFEYIDLYMRTGINLSVMMEEEPEPVVVVRDLSVERQKKLMSLNEEFKRLQDEAWLYTSLGFQIDANDEANRNVDGLIKLLEATDVTQTVMFMDYNNEVHPVTYENLKTMMVEIIINGNNLYAKKWELRTALLACTTIEEVDAIEIDLTVDNDFRN